SWYIRDWRWSPHTTSLCFNTGQQFQEAIRIFSHFFPQNKKMAEDRNDCPCAVTNMQ
ncbi:hypothetical protein L9F63_001025, partial [Diploptera punctata]